MRTRTAALTALLALGLHELAGQQAAVAGDTALTAASLPKGYASSAFTAPVAFGAGWGSVGAGVVGETKKQDMSMSVAAGLGDPVDWAGLDVAVVISSLSSSRLGESGFGEDGSVALKLHRTLGDYTSIAIGASAVGVWGTDIMHASNPAGHYLALSRAVFVGDHVLMLSGGAGHNVTNKNGNGDDVLASAAFYATHWLSFIAEYDGFGANAALSVAPLPRRLPVTLTAGLADLLEDHNTRPRIVLMAGIAYRF
jgi:hypothetical protein